MSFELAAAITIELEGRGALVNDPAGGVTRWGIAQKYHPDVDVVNLTREGALELLRARYWAMVNGDALSWPLGCVVFDEAVHRGPQRAIRTLHDALGIQVAGGGEGDRIVGEITLRALAGVRGVVAVRAFVTRMLRDRAAAYARSGSSNAPGWCARVADLALRVGAELPF